MYDFGAAEEPGTEAFDRPHPLLTASELARVSVEYPWSVLLDAVTPRRDEGAGRPVLVLPAFYADDRLTRRLRAHLRRLGYRAHPWGLGRNHGLTDEILEGVPARLDQLHERYDQPVTVVGWSFGGLLARWLAHQRPRAVRQVVCLGSPWRPEGERTRTTSMFARSAERHGLSDRAEQVVATLRRPLPVPATAIYSRTDGVLSWRACTLDEASGCENVAVPSSHVGLVSNPLALAVLADRLAQDPRHPRPFDWSSCLRRTLLGTGPAALVSA